MPRDWSPDEVELIVADYLDMLRKELTAVAYSKTRHRERLGPRLNRRSNGSIEFKHANISAVLVAYHLPYIEGYKPRANYQQRLEQAVLEYLSVHPEFFAALVDSPLLNPQDAQVPEDGEFSDLLEAPPEPAAAMAHVWTPDVRFVNVDFVRRDAENRRLGRLGEEFVLELERRRLHDEARRADLAKKVEWTADVRGDGAGYDIASFEPSGAPRYIEVKTTGLGKSFPFYVTANEVRCSEANDSGYHLYRLFRFSRHPGLFVLRGALPETCALDPVQFQVRFRE